MLSYTWEILGLPVGGGKIANSGFRGYPREKTRNVSIVYLFCEPDSISKSTRFYKNAKELQHSKYATVSMILRKILKKLH